MTPHPLLVENENKRLNFRLPLLICFAMYMAWQFAIVYFSSETLSLDGRTPLTMDADNFAILISVGYILSILVMIFIPHIIVWAERITAAIALLSALALFLPLLPETLAILFNLQCFCCFFMIGFETWIIVNLFTEKTAVKHLLVAYPVALVLVAIMQNDIHKVPFSVFRLFSVIVLILMLVFFFKLPAKTGLRSVKKSDGLIAPKSLFIGIYTLTVLAILMTLFSTAIAESVHNGVTVFFVSMAVCPIVIFLLWKRYRITVLQSSRTLVVIAALGFIMAIAAQFVPAFALVSCVLLGAGGVSCMLAPLFGLLLAKNYPSKYIAPVIIGIAFLDVLVQTALLEAFRDNLIILYVIYLVIAVALTLLYLMLEPYLGYSYRSRTLQDIIGVVAEDPDESETTEPALVTEKSIEKRSPLLTKAAAQKTTVQEEEPPHEQRMKMLMKHALSPLTRREYQAADCIMRGLRRAEIAQEMDVLPESVTKYTNRIYDKFGIHRRQDLFRLAETLDRE